MFHFIMKCHYEAMCSFHKGVTIICGACCGDGVTVECREGPVAKPQHEMFISMAACYNNKQEAQHTSLQSRTFTIFSC